MPAKLVRAAHVALPLPKGGEAEARQFYGQLLGFKEIMKPATLASRGGVWFDLGGFQVHLTPDEWAEKRPPGSGARPAFEITDAEGLRADLSKRQVNISDAPPIPGYRRFFALDPFGNRLEFLQKA